MSNRTHLKREEILQNIQESIIFYQTVQETKQLAAIIGKILIQRKQRVAIVEATAGGKIVRNHSGLIK